MRLFVALNCIRIKCLDLIGDVVNQITEFRARYVQHSYKYYFHSLAARRCDEKIIFCFCVYHHHDNLTMMSGYVNSLWISIFHISLHIRHLTHLFLSINVLRLSDSPPLTLNLSSLRREAWHWPWIVVDCCKMDQLQVRRAENDQLQIQIKNAVFVLC